MGEKRSVLSPVRSTRVPAEIQRRLVRRMPRVYSTVKK
jgi:hypothetical protein